MMKGLLDKFLKSLGLSGRDWVALLLALLLAFSIWLIHNLSLRYNDYLKVSVSAQCNIEGHSDRSVNRCEVVARCRTTGYNVIRLDIKGGRKPKKIVFQPSEMKHKDGDVFYVTSADLLEYSHLIYGDDVTVEYFVSDTLFFRFPQMDHKRVPVHPVHSISFSPQYMSVGELKVEPDSVTIYGEPYRLENIDVVYTQPIKRSYLTDDIQGVVGLERLRDVRFAVSEVRYLLDVTRFVEIPVKTQVEVVNLPDDKEIIVLPSTIDVALKCSFPLTGNPEKSIRLFVDYEDFLNSLTGKCPVRIETIPNGVIGYDLEPFYVECVVNDR